MKTTTKFIVFHPSLHKSSAAGRHHRLWLTILLLFFLFTFIFTQLTSKDTTGPNPPRAAVISTGIPKPVFTALLHYAADNFTSTSSDRMSGNEIRYIADAFRRCASPCNVLIFGLTHETLLWIALNHGGGSRTVIVDENAYLISKLEEEHPTVEAYDVQFTTKVSALGKLLHHYRVESTRQCRPVQNLLFSDCRLAINDLPNHLYNVDWDLILIDGPRGYFGDAPGRMAPIFTAGVLARSKPGGVERTTSVIVHEIGREVERICSEEFLCWENLVKKEGDLGHFVVRKFHGLQFCSSSSSGSPNLA